MNTSRIGRKLEAIFPRGIRKSGAEPGFLIVVGLLGLLFLMGGSARADISSLPLLRPLTVLAAAYGMWTMQAQHWRDGRWLLGVLGACFILVLLHATPLPPSFWQSLPGRGIVVEIDKAAGIEDQWRPISLAPAATWNAFYALFVPLAVLTNGIKLSREDHERLLVILLGMGFASGLLAVLQLLGSPRSALYLYRITNEGEGVGFFANRNHQAVFLSSMFPLLAAYAAGKGKSRTSDRRRLAGAALAGLLLIPIILISGSRTGLATSLVGLAMIPMLYRAWIPKGRKGQKANRQFVFGVAGLTLVVASLAAWASLADRAVAIRRMLGETGGAELRLEYWPVIVHAIPEYLPLGSGIGSYERVYQVIEPASQLRAVYSNHAHNDFLEVALTAGIPGLALVFAVAVLIFCSAVRVVGLSRERQAQAKWGWLGIAIVVIASLASLTDYPLRVPLLSAWFVIACLWVRLGATATRIAGPAS